MFARVMGPYLTIIAASAALRPNAMRAMLSDSKPTRCGRG